MGTAEFEARLAAMPALYKGVGALFSLSHYERSNDDLKAKAAIVTNGSADPHSALWLALEGMPDTMARKVVANSLGTGEYRGLMFPERRKRFARAANISMRTLFRYQAEGAQQLLLYLDDLESPLSDEGARAMLLSFGDKLEGMKAESLSGLDTRIEELEATLAALRQARDELAGQKIAKPDR